MDRTIMEAKCLSEGKRHDDVCKCCGKEIHFVLKNEGFSKCAGTFCASGQNDEKELREFAVTQAFRRIEMECFNMPLEMMEVRKPCNIAVNTNESFKPFEGEVFCTTKEDFDDIDQAIIECFA